MEGYYIEKTDDHFQTVFPSELSDYSQSHPDLASAVKQFEDYGLRWNKIHFVDAILCCTECKGSGAILGIRPKGLWIERCDCCQKFASDEEAQTAILNLVQTQL